MSWGELYGVLSRAVDSERTAQATRTAYEQWCRDAEEDVMSQLHRGAIARAQDIQQRTGSVFGVQYPVEPAWMRPQAGVSVRVLGLTFRAAGVDLYWYRAAGGRPFVHLAHMRASPGQSRFPVVISLPGCRVERTLDSQTQLRDVSSPAVVDRLMSPDALLLRAFTILVNAGGA